MCENKQPYPPSASAVPVEQVKGWHDIVIDAATGVYAAAGLAGECGNAGRAVTGLLQRMSKTGDPIAQDCFKLLATLMRESETYQPSNAQLRFLLTWAFSDMEEAAGRQAAFGLLKVSLSFKYAWEVGRMVLSVG